MNQNEIIAKVIALTSLSEMALLVIIYFFVQWYTKKQDEKNAKLKEEIDQYEHDFETPGYNKQVHENLYHSDNLLHRQFAYMNIETIFYYIRKNNRPSPGQKGVTFQEILEDINFGQRTIRQMDNNTWARTHYGFILIRTNPGVGGDERKPGLFFSFDGAFPEEINWKKSDKA